MFLLDKIFNFGDDIANGVMQTVYIAMLVVCVCAVVALILASVFKLRKAKSCHRLDASFFRFR